MTTSCPSDRPEETFREFLQIIRQLRDPVRGCPWDKEQTLETLGPLLVEETYEVIDAVERGDGKVSEELGDVLSLWALYCQIGTDSAQFTANEVIQIISEKLIRRHPHVFGETKVEGTGEVLKNWERIKQSEGAAPNRKKSVLESVPRSMPALLRAQRVSEKCARIGFEWRNFADIKAKVTEEIQEFLEAAEESPQGHDAEAAAEELGDLFFSLVQVARRMNLSSEDLLRKATDKFIRRFQAIETLAYESGREKGVVGMTLEEMDALWDEVKVLEKAASETKS